MYCLWIAKDLEEQDLGSRFGTLTLASKDSSSTLDKSLGEVSFFFASDKMAIKYIIPSLDILFCQITTFIKVFFKSFTLK